MTALVGIVTALAAGLVSVSTATASTPTEPVVNDEHVVAAKFGVVSFLVQNLATPVVDGPCPIVPQDELATRAGQHGLSPTTSGYVVYSTYDEVAGLPSAGCGVDVEATPAEPDPAAPHAIQLTAMVIDERAMFQDLFLQVEGATFTAAVEGIGGEMGGSCDGADPALCAVAWHRDGLVISLWLAGPAADIDQRITEGFLAAVVPDAVDNLAAYGESIAPGAAPVPSAPAVPTVTGAPPSSVLAANPAPAPPHPEPTTSDATVPVDPVPMPVPEPVTSSSVPPVPLPVPVTTTASG